MQLFVGCGDEARTEDYVLEESGTGSPALLSKHYFAIGQRGAKRDHGLRPNP